MLNIPKNEIIHCESFYALADYHYKEQDDLPSGVVHVDIGSIPDFFRKIDNNGNDYIVISSRSDFCLCYQEQYPVYADIHKAAKMFARPEWGYTKQLVLPPRCNIDRCHPDDKFSIKCYSYTEATFDKIPENVKYWFVCNNMTKENNIISIPFGINCTDGNLSALNDIVEFPKLERNKILYVNFQFYTNERLEYWYYFNSLNWATVEKDVSFDKFLNGLATHAFCLCPAGNGIDCYRTYEALYMGCSPVLQAQDVIYLPFLHALPIVSTSSFFNLDPNVLKNLYNNHINNMVFDNSRITLSYWKNKIDKLRILYGL